MIHSKSDKEILYVNGMRAIACLIVLCAHVLSTSTNYGIYASGCGKIGVWFFMVISGYLTIKPYIEKRKVFSFKSVLEYYAKKIINIYLIYLLCLIVGYFCKLYDLNTFKDSLICINAWGHFWYIPVILKFYLIVPIITGLYELLKRLLHDEKKIDFSFLAVIMVTTVVIYFFFPSNNYIENSISIFYYIPVFSIGMLLAMIEKYRKFEINNGDSLFVVSTLIMLIFTPAGRQIIFHCEPSRWLQNKYLLIGSLWGLAIFGINSVGNSSKSYIKNILSNSKILNFISKISFEIYLVHFIILLKIIPIVKIPFLLKACVVIILSICIAYVLNIARSFIVEKTKNHTIIVAMIIVFCIAISYFAINKTQAVYDEEKYQSEWFESSLGFSTPPYYITNFDEKYYCT